MRGLASRAGRGERCRLTSPPIGQPLAYRATDRAIGALAVVNPELGAVAVAEIELCQIAVQVLLGAMLVDALHAALED